MRRWFTSRRAAILLPTLALLAGLVCATAGASWLQIRAQRDADAEFARIQQRMSAEIENRFRKPVYGLNGALGMYATHREVRREAFRNYVESRSLSMEFPGVRGFGFIQRVPREALASFVAAEQADGWPSFAVRQLELKDQPDHFIIKFIEPLSRNAGALGLDVGSEAVRRRGAQRAMESGAPTVTGVITLVQDDRRSPGVLLYVPVYEKQPGAVTSDYKIGPLRGLLYAPIVIAELLEGLHDADTGQVQVELFDAASGTVDGQTMYDSSRATGPDAAAASSLPPRFEAMNLISLPGRLVTMRLRSTPAFELMHSSQAPVLFFIGTLLGSALLAALLRQQANGNRSAQARAEQMTADLNRLALVARRTTNAVVITDVNRRITWVNEGFERLTGYASAEVMGRSPGAMLQHETTDPATVLRMREALNAGQGFSGELFNRGKHGRRYWLSVEIQPLHDTAGALTGFMAIEQDITERRHAEGALRASRSLLDRTGRIGGVGGWEMDMATKRVAWTDETCRIHGLPPGHTPSLAEALSFYSPQARADIERAFRQCHDSGCGFDLELPMITAGGRAVWVRTVGELEWQDGQPLRIVGALQDITARRDMEAQIRRSNALLNSVLESLPCGLSVFDGDLRLVLCNNEFGRLLELPERLCDPDVVVFEDIIRFNAERGEYGPGDVSSTVQGIVARARQPAVPHLFERSRPNGTVLEVRGAPMAGGGFVTTYTDVSARHLAQADAQRSNQLLRGAIDAIDEAFVLYDPDDRLVLCNERYREIYAGVAELIVPGVRFEDLVRVGAERGNYLAARGRVDAWVAERVAAHQSANSTILQKLDNGKTLRIVERKLPDGHIVGFRVDISELASATEAAQQASLAKSQFLANMSHEIRTPMNAILGMLALLKKTALTPRQADYTVKTEGAARSLLGLLDDILDFSKVEAGKMTLDPQPFRTDELLRNLSVILSANVGAKPVEVLFDIDADLPRRLVGDALRLQQVLINLGGNAVKFTAAGEVVVQVRVLAHRDGAVTLRVAVRDTGIGIAPENQARIFSGFTQAEASTTRRFGGTGLGVAISQRLVNLMGGQLQLDSVPGKGSCFHFQITLLEAALDDEPAATAAAVPEATQRPLRALVIDDHAAAREVLARMAASLGWTVDTAAGGEQALALLQAQTLQRMRYDVVFVDWQMPDLDGFDTARLINERGLGDDAPVIVMVTANGREELAQRSPADQQLLDGFVVKPVTATMLLDAVVDARRGDLPALPHPSHCDAPPTDQRLAGLRLLVAEDNPNNQQVARELLEDEGASVQIAADGQTAVQALDAADPPFDAVLMDLQMPVMDGFTATRRIRGDLQLTTLPIVAMTANAMASDRDACLAAGMNDHVGKPFEIDHLVEVLLRLTGRRPRTPVTSRRDHAALPTAVIERADEAGVDIVAALSRLNGKLLIYSRMLATFGHDLPDLVAQLQAHAQSGDRVTASRVVHTLKGLAATLGATRLASAAADGERRLNQVRTDGRNGDAAAPADDTAAVCQSVCQAIDQSRAALQALQQALQGAGTNVDGPEGAATAGDGPPAAALRELAQLLENADMRATDVMAQLQQQHGTATNRDWQALGEAVFQLDFDRARQLCQSWLAESPA